MRALRLPLVGFLEGEATARRVLVTALVASLLAPLNSTMIAVALPAIRAEFDVGLHLVAWLVGSYLILMALAQPVGGKLGDTYGRERVLVAGLLLFLVASLLAALAWSFAALVVFRCLQAVGGAITVPNSGALLRQAYPTERRASAFGLMGASISLAAALGPLIGGAMIAASDWRAMFYINVPIVALALPLAVSLGLPRLREQAPAPFDFLGTVLLGLVFFFAVLAINVVRSGPLLLASVSSAVAGAALVLLLKRETSYGNPLIDPSFLRDRTFAAACGAILFSNLTMYTVLLAMPVFLTEVQGRDAAETGLMLMSLTILAAFVAPLGGRLADSAGRGAPAVAGALGLVAAVALLLPISRGMAAWHVALALSLVGLGIGLSTAAVQTAAVESVPARLAASAQGVYSTARYTGSIVGAGILGAVLRSEKGGPPIADFRVLLVILLVAATASLAASLRIGAGALARERAATPATALDEGA